MSYVFESGFHGCTLEQYVQNINKGISLIKETEPNVDSDMDYFNFYSLKEGEKVVCTGSAAAVLVKAKDGFMYVMEPDPYIQTLHRRLNQALAYKENTAFKIIERTAKLDAYYSVKRLVDRIIKSKEEGKNWEFELTYLQKYLTTKIDSHHSYVVSQPVTYEYSTQSFKPVEKLPLD